MGISADKKTVVIDDEELDIYASMELRSVLQSVLDAGVDSLKLDLSNVSSLSTPAVQVVLSAVRSFKNLEITGEIGASINTDLKNMGVDLWHQ